MNVLAIETATDAVAVALLRDDGGAAERVHSGGREHAERLVPMIEEVCAAAGCPLSDVGVVAVDVGPGLFTGLRVGVATAKALAYARGVRLLGVSSLDILAGAAAGHALAAASRVETIVPVVDARRGEVFAASYRFARAASEAVRPADGPEPDRGGGAAARTVVDVAPAVDDQPGALSPDELVEWCRRQGSALGSVLVVGDGAVRYLDRLATETVLDLGAAATLAVPPAAALARLAAGRLADGAPTVRADDLVPDYRRPADARINWEQRAEHPVTATGTEGGPGR